MLVPHRLANLRFVIVGRSVVDEGCGDFECEPNDVDLDQKGFDGSLANAEQEEDLVPLDALLYEEMKAEARKREEWALLVRAFDVLAANKSSRRERK